MNRIIQAELAFDDTATACGITVRSSTPVLALCRRLLDAGHEPSARLHVYRGSTLALDVRSLGEAAGLEFDGDKMAFRRARKRVPQPRPCGEMAGAVSHAAAEPGT
jgi:hypothetical protein